MNTFTQQSLSRRRFLQSAGLVVGGSLLAACTVPNAPGGTPAAGTGGAESLSHRGLSDALVVGVSVQGASRCADGSGGVH